MAHIILVHGAWLDARCWDATAHALRDAGHTVVAPDLPGHGADTTPLGGQTLAAYAARVVDAIDAASAPVVLVGHSLGGLVISAAAEQRAELVQRLVYVAAYLLGDGETIQQQADPDSQVPAAMRPAADWSTVAIDPALMPAVFFHDVPDAVRTPLLAHAAAEATAPFGTPLVVTADRWGRVPRSYITTTQDRAVTSALQRQFLAARPCEPVIPIASGHLPFLARPTEFVDALMRCLA